MVEQRVSAANSIHLSRSSSFYLDHQQQQQQQQNKNQPDLSQTPTDENSFFRNSSGYFGKSSLGAGPIRFEVGDDDDDEEDEDDGDDERELEIINSSLSQSLRAVNENTDLMPNFAKLVNKPTAPIDMRPKQALKSVDDDNLSSTLKENNSFINTLKESSFTGGTLIEATGTYMAGMSSGSSGEQTNHEPISGEKFKKRNRRRRHKKNSLSSPQNTSNGSPETPKIPIKPATNNKSSSSSSSVSTPSSSPEQEMAHFEMDDFSRPTTTKSSRRRRRHKPYQDDYLAPNE